VAQQKSSRTGLRQLIFGGIRQLLKTLEINSTCRPISPEKQAVQQSSDTTPFSTYATNP